MNDFNGGRFFVSIFAGTVAFFMFYFLITFMLGHLGVTPHGKFMKEYFGGKDRAVTIELVKADPDKYQQMLDEKTKFDNMFITPWAGFMGCIIVGVIAGSYGVMAATVTAILLTFTFYGHLEGDPAKNLLVFVFIALSAIGGITGQYLSPLISKYIKDQNEIDDAKRAEIRAKALENEKKNDDNK